jgi:hypothetical protein
MQLFSVMPSYITKHSSALCLMLAALASPCIAHTAHHYDVQKISPSFQQHLHDVHQPIFNVLMLMRLSAKQVATKYNLSIAQYNALLEQWSSMLHEMSSITHAEIVLQAICEFMCIPSLCALTKMTTWEEQLDAVVATCDAIKHVIADVKLTRYQQICRSITESHPLIRFSLAASAVSIAGALLYKFDNPLINKVEKVFSNTFEWSRQQIKGASVSPEIKAQVAVPVRSLVGTAAPVVKVQEASLLSSNFAKGGALILGTACAAYFKEICDFVISPVKESIVDIQQRIHKFVSTQKNTKPRGPSTQSLPMSEIAPHKGLRSYLERLALHNVVKDDNLALGIVESGGVLIIGDPYEADRLAQAIATLATTIAKNQPLALPTKLAAQLTAGYFGGPVEFPMQRFEATYFGAVDKKAFDIIKDLNTNSCIIIIHNLDATMADEQKAQLVYQLNSLSGLSNDPLTRYFFIGVAQHKEDVPEALFNSPMSLFKDVYTLTPSDHAEVLAAYLKTLNRMYLIEDTEALRSLLRDALNSGKNLMHVQAAIMRAAADAAAQCGALTEEMIAEQLNAY